MATNTKQFCYKQSSEDDYVFVGNSKKLWQKIPKDYLKQQESEE